MPHLTTQPFEHPVMSDAHLARAARPLRCAGAWLLVLPASKAPVAHAASYCTRRDATDLPGALQLLLSFAPGICAPLRRRCPSISPRWTAPAHAQCACSSSGAATPVHIQHSRPAQSAFTLPPMPLYRSRTLPGSSCPECHNIKPWADLLRPLRACRSLAHRAAGELREETFVLLGPRVACITSWAEEQGGAHRIGTAQ